MKNISSLPVRAQLAVAAAIFVLPAAGIIVWSRLHAREEEIREAHLETQKLAASIVAVHESRVLAAEQLLMAIAGMDSVRNRDVDRVAPMLRDVLSANPAYHNILVADAKGDVWASAVPTPGLNIADRRYFRSAMATGRLSSGEYVTSRVMSRPTFHFAYPIRHGGNEIVGVIAVALDLGAYLHLLATAHLPPRSSFAFIDHAGIMIARAIDPARYVGRPVEPELFGAIRAGSDDETGIGAGLSGEVKVQTFRKLRLAGEDTPYMYLCVGIPFESVIAGANRALARDVVLLLSCVLLALVVAWVFAKRTIVDRIGLLENASRRLAGGDLAVRVGQVVRGGELGRLGRSFDAMAEQLAAREKALRETEQKFLHVQKMETVGRLAGGVAHDFNNMLAVILGEVAFAKERLPENDVLRESVAEIEKAAFRSRDITRQLLAFSRKQVVSPRAIDMNGAIAALHPALARLIGEDVELSVALAPTVWNVRLDPSQLDQILMNLAVNARDAMPCGGRLRIETTNTTVDETVCRTNDDAAPGPYARITVTDDGVGMDATVLSHLFEPFFTTKGPGKGTGLGLATVYGIVKQNGGFIVVRSAPGRGSTFEIHLPRDRGEPDVRGEEVPSPAAAGRATILLVEDDTMVLRVVERMLKGMGHAVLVARSASEALSLAAQPEVTIDLLLTDVMMPGMKGTELQERIASARPGVRTLLMSGHVEDLAERDGTVRLAGQAFIQKPFEAEALARQLRRVMA